MSREHSHPLMGFVYDLAAEGKILDRVELARKLSGTSAFVGRDAGKGWKAYLTVAEDVIGWMLDEGFIVEADSTFVVGMDKNKTPVRLRKSSSKE